MAKRDPIRHNSWRPVALVIFAVSLSVLGWELGRWVVLRAELQAFTDHVALLTAADQESRIGHSQDGRSRDAMPNVTKKLPNSFTVTRVERGYWDSGMRIFHTMETGVDAVRVLAAGQKRRTSFVSYIIPTPKTESVAAAVSRDIVFVIDISGAMDTNNSPDRTTDKPQPLDAVCKALTGAIELLAEQQSSTHLARDRVCVITCDNLQLGGAQIAFPLSDEYASANLIVNQLQAGPDKGPRSVFEAALLLAQQHVAANRPRSTFPLHRDTLLVFLTASTPAQHVSPSSIIEQFEKKHPTLAIPGSDTQCSNAALRQLYLMVRQGWQIIPIGVGSEVSPGWIEGATRVAAPTSATASKMRLFCTPRAYTNDLAESLREVIATRRYELVN